MKLFTPEQYTKYQIVKYPALFSGVGTTYEIARVRIMDQLFNVIGNGILDDDDLLNTLEYNSDWKSYSSKYFEQEIYYVADEEIKLGAPTSMLAEDVSKWKPKMLFERNKILTSMPISQFDPYPNFKKEYSLAYKCPLFLSLEKNWITEAIWFYEQCKEFFKSTPGLYHYAFPKDNDNNDRIVREQEEYFGNRTHEEISKSWKYPYDGDTHKFLTGKWQKELVSINEFIDNSIKLLNGKLM
jgi:hypothetical protein